MMRETIQTAATPERQVPPTASGAHARKDVNVRSAALTATKAYMAGEDRQRLIAEAAYFRAEQRGFLPGNELEDWLAAEIEVDTLFGDNER